MNKIHCIRVDDEEVMQWKININIMQNKPMIAGKLTNELMNQNR